MIKISGKLILTMFNIGKLGNFPGTIASAITSFLYIFFFYFKVHYLTLFLIFLFLLLVSVYLINLLKDEFEEVDSKEIVIDEYLGQSIPICLYEIAHEGTKEINNVLTYYFVMFILFRVFDIAKPYPVSYYDKNFKNSFGVIMDDVCAGLYVVAILVLYMVITS